MTAKEKDNIIAVKHVASTMSLEEMYFPKEFLREMGELFDVIIFTCSGGEYTVSEKNINLSNNIYCISLKVKTYFEIKDLLETLKLINYI